VRPIADSTALGLGLVALLAACSGDTIGCAASESTSPTTAARQQVSIVCGERAHELVVTEPYLLDATGVCGAPWSVLRVDTRGRTEFVKANPDRELWLRPGREAPVVELRRGDKVESRFAAVTSIADVPKAAPRTSERVVELTHGAHTESLTVRELKDRFRSKEAGSGHEISLCAVADRFEAKTIEVFGELPEPIKMTRTECATAGYVLRFGSRGEVRLRGPTRDKRYLQSVARIVLNPIRMAPRPIASIRSGEAAALQIAL
jgi:hypothetical protein